VNGAAGGLVDDGQCIGCGPRAPFGLHMRFDVHPDKSVESTVTVGAAFAGWRGVVHGGIVALLLDEAMAYAAGAHGVLAVTGDLRLRFRASVPVDAPLRVTGSLLWRRRGVLGLVARINAADGALLASAEGSFVQRGALAPGTLFGESRLRGA
jgi:acyl-coenzyme A thioesterase PaaI-like protein